MQHLDSIIEEYLSKPTDYAVQLVGGWGIGKTHYYRHQLENKIAATPVHSNAEKNYKPVYISLFGLKSVEDIHTKMVVDFFSSKLFKGYRKDSRTKKRIKITQSIFKIGMRGFLGFHQLGDVNDYLTDVREIGANALDSQELLICFDDLERKDSAMQLPDLIGYINSLVDERIKVLVIANEDLLKGKDDSTYEHLKEKVIGVTIAYEPDVAVTLQTIIAARYGGSAVYRNFLSPHTQRLEQLALAAENNFRHIQYGLDRLQLVYAQIKNQVLDPGHRIKDKVTEQMGHIMVLTMALAIEYKASRLSHKEMDIYENDVLMSLLDGDGQDRATKAPGARLRQTYAIASEHYHIYPSIFRYVTMVAAFDVEAFIQEFSKRFMMVDGAVPAEFQLMSDLDYKHCYDLDDQAYREKTLAMLDYAYAGAYPLSAYLTVMQFAERFDNWLGLDLAQVRNGLLAALTKVLDKTEPGGNEMSQFEMTGSRLPEWPEYTRFYSDGLEAIRDHRSANRQAEFAQLAGELQSDPGAFLQKYFEDYPFQTRVDAAPVFQYADMATLAAALQAEGGKTLIYMRQFLRQRYSDQRPPGAEGANLARLRDFMSAFSDAVKQSGPHMLALGAAEFSHALTAISARGGGQVITTSASHHDFPGIDAEDEV